MVEDGVWLISQGQRKESRWAKKLVTQQEEKEKEQKEKREAEATPRRQTHTERGEIDR